MIRVVAFVAALVASSACLSSSPRSAYLDIATTTSVKNSGLVADLLPAFTEASGLIVRVHAAGSGRALEMLADGVVDLALTHAPETEARYLTEHANWAYRKIAYNKFVIVGPKHDPANIRPAADAVDAFKRIAATDVNFISRNDISGTHERESALWKAAGTRPSGDRLVVTAASMGVALRHTDERVGYTLSDEATFRQLQPHLDLTVLFANDARLLNTYAVVHPQAVDSAVTFANWLAAGDGRRRLANYRVAGSAVFFAWPSGCAGDRPDARLCGEP
jgi:tungstate transport system substrate-binding protein